MICIQYIICIHVCVCFWFLSRLVRSHNISKTNENNILSYPERANTLRVNTTFDLATGTQLADDWLTEVTFMIFHDFGVGLNTVCSSAEHNLK